MHLMAMLLAFPQNGILLRRSKLRKRCFTDSDVLLFRAELGLIVLVTSAVLAVSVVYFTFVDPLRSPRVSLWHSLGDRRVGGVTSGASAQVPATHKAGCCMVSDSSSPGSAHPGCVGSDGIFPDPMGSIRVSDSV